MNSSGVKGPGGANTTSRGPNKSDLGNLGQQIPKKLFGKIKKKLSDAFKSFKSFFGGGRSGAAQGGKSASAQGPAADSEQSPAGPDEKDLKTDPQGRTKRNVCFSDHIQEHTYHPDDPIEFQNDEQAWNASEAGGAAGAQRGDQPGPAAGATVRVDTSKDEAIARALIKEEPELLSDSEREARANQEAIDAAVAKNLAEQFKAEAGAPAAAPAAQAEPAAPESNPDLDKINNAIDKLETVDGLEINKNSLKNIAKQIVKNSTDLKLELFESQFDNLNLAHVKALLTVFDQSGVTMSDKIRSAVQSQWDKKMASQYMTKITNALAVLTRKNNSGAIEVTHDFVQIVFPNRRPGQHNENIYLGPGQGVIDELSKQGFIDHIIAGLKPMLQHWGFDINDDDGSITGNANYYIACHSDHNQYRLTRVIECLGLFKDKDDSGYLEKAFNTFEARLPKTVSSYRDHWQKKFREFKSDTAPNPGPGQAPGAIYGGLLDIKAFQNNQQQTQQKERQRNSDIQLAQGTLDSLDLYDDDDQKKAAKATLTILTNLMYGANDQMGDQRPNADEALNQINQGGMIGDWPRYVLPQHAGVEGIVYEQTEENKVPHDIYIESPENNNFGVRSLQHAKDLMEDYTSFRKSYEAMVGAITDQLRSGNPDITLDSLFGPHTGKVRSSITLFLKALKDSDKGEDKALLKKMEQLKELVEYTIGQNKFDCHHTLNLIALETINNAIDKLETVDGQEINKEFLKNIANQIVKNSTDLELKLFNLQFEGLGSADVKALLDAFDQSGVTMTHTIRSVVESQMKEKMARERAELDDAAFARALFEKDSAEMKQDRKAQEAVDAALARAIHEQGVGPGGNAVPAAAHAAPAAAQAGPAAPQEIPDQAQQDLKLRMTEALAPALKSFEKEVRQGDVIVKEIELNSQLYSVKLVDDVIVGIEPFDQFKTVANSDEHINLAIGSLTSIGATLNVDNFNEKLRTKTSFYKGVSDNPSINDGSVFKQAGFRAVFEEIAQEQGVEFQAEEQKSIWKEQFKRLYTVGDGNCAFNGVALGLLHGLSADQIDCCGLTIDRDKLDADPKVFSDDIPNPVTGKWLKDQFKSVIGSGDGDPKNSVKLRRLQQAMAPSLREQAVAAVRDQWKSYKDQLKEHLLQLIDTLNSGNKEMLNHDILKVFGEGMMALVEIATSEDSEQDLSDWLDNAGKDAYLKTLGTNGFNADNMPIDALVQGLSKKTDVVLCASAARSEHNLNISVPVNIDSVSTQMVLTVGEKNLFFLFHKLGLANQNNDQLYYKTNDELKKVASWDCCKTG